jgi:hypothetical protein
MHGVKLVRTPAKKSAGIAVSGLLRESRRGGDREWTLRRRR